MLLPAGGVGTDSVCGRTQAPTNITHSTAGLVMAQRNTDDMPPSSLRVGVDLVLVADVATSILRFGDRYTERVYTADERAYCNEKHARSAARYAARFAAKEATIKVLRPMLDEAVDLRLIEVRRLPGGACDIALHDAALALARRAGIAELAVSMSHEHDYATATVVARVAQTPAVE